MAKTTAVAERKYLYIRSTRQVVGFNPHLLGRNDIELITQKQRDRIIQKLEDERREAREQREIDLQEDAIKRAQEEGGMRPFDGNVDKVDRMLAGEDDDDDEEGEEDVSGGAYDPNVAGGDDRVMQPRERSEAHRRRGEQGRKSSRENLNNDPNAAYGGLEPQAENIEQQHKEAKKPVGGESLADLAAKATSGKS